MSTLKQLKNEEIKTTKVLLHETIPVTGSLISGTYGTTSDVRGNNIKTYDHGMFQSVYDYPYLSSSANQIFDITLGINNQTVASQSVDKANIYHEMAQVLYGYDVTASINPFKVSGSYDETATIIENAAFINFSRLLAKDEIQKGTFRLTLGMSGSNNAALAFDYFNPFGHLFYIGDYGATTSFNDTNSPAGEFGVLRSGSSATDTSAANNDALGIIYYQAGLVVLDLSATIDLATAPQGGISPDSLHFAKSNNTNPTYLTYTGSIESGTIDEFADGLRNRIYNIEFNNSTELNSTIYFCRAGADEFNYSSNPTYLSSSQIRVKGNDASNPPLSYITTVGLYAGDGALVATAKLSEPIRKTPSNDLTIRVRLDY